MWGAAPPTPPSRTSRRCAPLQPTHPPSDVLSVGGCAPHAPTRKYRGRILPPLPSRERGVRGPPPAGQQPPEGAPRVCLWGLRPHTIPDERAAGSGPPTRPRISLLWGLRPHAPTRIGSATAAHREHPLRSPSPLARPFQNRHFGSTSRHSGESRNPGAMGSLDCVDSHPDVALLRELRTGPRPGEGEGDSGSRNAPGQLRKGLPMGRVNETRNRGSGNASAWCTEEPCGRA